MPQHPIQLSNSHARSPVLFVRRRVRLHALASQQMRGGGAPSGAPALCSRLNRSAGAQTNPGVLRALSQARSPLGAPAAAFHRFRAALLGGELPRASASSSQPGRSARRAVPRNRPSAQGHVSPAPAGAASGRGGISPQQPPKGQPVSPRPPFPARSASERLRRRPSRARTRIIYREIG